MEWHKVANVAFHRAVMYLAICAVATSTSACAVIEGDAAGAYVTGRHVGETNLAFTSADDRIVIERLKAGTSNERVICTEPPPDTAKVMQAIIEANGGTTAVSAGASAGIAEAALELAGRSTALLGLRDGLYRACEAYANGAIGADAYALVLTRYGELMTTLFLGQDITGAAGTSSGSTVSAPSVNVNSPGNMIQNGSTNGGGGNGKGGAGAATSMASPPQTAVPAATRPAEPYGQAVLTPIAATTTKGGNPAAPAAPAATDATDMMSGMPAAPRGDQSQNQPGSPPANSSSASALPSTSALGLVRMNEDFLGLNLFPISTLLVACVNSSDQTRGSGYSKNAYLNPICGKLDLGMIQTFGNSAADLAMKVGRVDPTAGTSQAAAKPQAKPAPNEIMLAAADLTALRAALNKKFSYVAAMGGRAPDLAVGLIAYQSQAGLVVTGYADQETLDSLGVKIQVK